MANKKKKKTKSAFEVLDQRRNEQIAQMSKGSTSTYKKLNKMLAPSSKEQISTGSIKTNNQTSIDYASNNTRDVSRKIIAPVYSSDTSSKKTQLNIISEEEQKAKLKTPLELLQEQRENQTEENQQNEKLKMPSELLQEQQQKQFEEKQQKSKEASEKRVEQKKKDEKENRTWFKSGAFEDGYDFGDVTKTILGTAGDIGTNILKGVTSAGDSLGKLMAGGVAEFSDLIGQDEYAEKLRNRLAGKDEELNKKIEKFTLTPYLQKASDKLDDSSLTGDKTDSLASSVGQLGASASAQAVGIPWWLVSGGSSAGVELENAYKSGATSGEAWGSALISGASEVAFEKLGGIKFGGKALDTGLKQTLSKQLTNKTAQTLTKFGIDVGTEGAEEVLTEITSNLGKKLTYEDEKTLNEVLFSEEAMDSYLEAFIGGAVLGGGFNVGKTINSAKTGRDYDTGLTQNEQSVIDNVVSQRTTEMQKQKAVEEKINRVIEEQEATRGTLTDEAKQEIKNRVMQEDIDYSTSKLSKKEIAKIEEEVRQDLERGEIDIDTIESTLSSEKTARIKELIEERSKTTNEQERLKIQAEIGKLEEAKNSELIEMLKKDNLLQNSYREANLKNEKFTYEAKNTDSEYKKKLAEDFKKLANNSTRTHETFEMISKIAEDSKTNYSITNNEQLKNLGYDIDGKDVNGLVRINKDGSQSVLINIDSKKAINRIVGHETTHILEGTKEYDEFKEFAKQYATTKGEYDSRLKSTKELYKGVKDANVENEVTADIVGDYLFTDTDFINNLSTEKPNIFKRVYEEIKHLYKMATAESKEERQLLQLKKSFEKIYQKNEIQTDTKTKYHISKIYEQKKERGTGFSTAAGSFHKDNIPQSNTNVKSSTSSTKYSIQNNENDTQRTEKSSFSLKQKQNEIIQKTNPVNDDYHTWIRNINDIKTFEETLQDSDYKEYYEAGEDFDETYSANMAKEALETGKITVYSSYPIEQGIFVSPSRMEAESYSGNGKVYSKEVNLTDVAWIDPTQGQYAKINNTDYSLSNGEQTAQSRNDIFGKDIKYQDETKKQVEQAIAPLKEEVKTLTKEITDLRENVAPISLEEAEMLRKESFNSITDKDAPIEQETNDYIPENEVTESKDLFEIRDYAEVGKRSINAYQYDNPEVKPYFQDMARGMLQDLKNSTKGERIIDANVLYETNGESGIWGTKRDVPNDIAELLDGVDGKYKLSYKDIEKGLNAIIEDHGAENNVASKRIEFYLDQRLRNGYTDFFYGDVFEPNQEYLNLVSQDNRFNVEEQYNEWLKTLPNELPSDYAPYLEMAKEIVSNSPKTNEISSISNELDRINTIAPINEKAVNNNDLGYVLQDTTKESTYNEPSITNPVDAFLNKELTNRFEKGTKQTVISKQKGKSAFRDTMSYLFVNKNRAIDKFSDEVGNKNIKILADHVNNVFGEISTNISKVQTDNNGKAIGKGITEIFNQARKSKLSEAFDDYLFHKSNIERHKNGKGSVVPANDSARLVLEYDKTYPEFKIWGDEVNNFNKNNLYKQVDAGLISKELADNITNMYDFYVPFFENIERDYVKTDTGEITTRSAVKRAKGGADKNLLGFEKAMMKQTQNTISSIRKNQLYREIIDSTHNKQIGLDLNDGTFADENGYYLTAYEDGSQVSANISKELYDGLNNNLEQTVKDVEQKLSLITKPLQALSNARRNLLTNWSPTFILTNPIKDLQDATLNSKYLKDWSINYPKALKELFTGKGKHLEQFLNMYGQANLMGDYSIDSGISDITKSVKIKGKSRFGISTLNEMLELAPRYAEYLASIKNGASQMEALYNAREVTTNFGRGGVISKAVNRNGFTFWNASVQGFNKLYRNFSGENGAKGVARGVVVASLKALSLGVGPALYNALMFGLGDDEDEDYKVLPDYIKDNYYLIKTDNGNFIRIPKGRMISVFGSAGRRTLELMQGEKDAFDGYLKNAYSQVGISNPMESNILAPLIQAYGSENGKTWYETDIVPSRLQDVPKDEQYDESIDKLSIWLGEKTGISPYKANYVIDQYTGGIGDMILPTITEEAQSDSDGLLGTAIAPLKDKFTADSTTDNKYVSEFYTKNDELKVKSNSSKATEEDLLVNQYMKSVSSEMGALYSEMREVQANKNLSKSEKYKKAQAIKKQINELAEEGLNGYKNVNKTDNYAEVGGREFYKWTNDEGEVVWSKPDEAESDELNAMGLDIQEKSSYYTIKSKIYDIWDKYGDSDNYESKNKEIGQAIINSGLPDEAKYSLYDFSKGKYADTETTQALKLLDLDADTFISYASQTFKADKDSNGKSISGSKKKKVFDYINSMRNISFEQKAILAKLQYNNYDEWNYDIIDYLNNSSMTYEEMEFVLKQMGFKVKSDGTITWD